MRIPVSPSALGVGLVVVAVGIAGVFWMQRGAHIEVKGSILKVRTQAMDEASSVALVDFRVANPADYRFVVQEVKVSVEGPDGKIVEGATVSDSDVQRLFQYYPALGQKFNDTLMMRQKIEPKQSMDRMIAARFEIPEEKLQAHRKLIVRIEDVDGPASELIETRR